MAAGGAGAPGLSLLLAGGMSYGHSPRKAHIAHRGQDGRHKVEVEAQTTP